MDIVLRITVLYIFLLVALRIIGKRELGEMSPMEFLTLMLIPEIVSQALTDEDYSVTGAAVGVATLLCLVFLSSLLSYRFKNLGSIIEGTSTILVDNGTLVQQYADRERISLDEIYSEMHKQGYTRLDELRWVILEPDGKLAFIPHHRTDQHRQSSHHLH